MKKAYVKVKNNSTKSILKRPYIAATLAGALLCALVLSVSVPKQEKTENNQQLTTTVEQVQPKEATESLQEKTESTEKTTKTETSKKTETVVPKINETELPKTNEIPQEETVSVGLFGEEKIVKMKRPTTGEITKPYSEGKPVKSETMGDWRVHNGMDIYAEQGTEILAPADGEIIRAETDPLTGVTVVIDHGKGTVSTIYNLENTDSVKQGQKVKAGDRIGTAGNTAKCEMADDAHVHFEVTVDGKYQNPEAFLE